MSNTISSGSSARVSHDTSAVSSTVVPGGVAEKRPIERQPEDFLDRSIIKNKSGDPILTVREAGATTVAMAVLGGGLAFALGPVVAAGCIAGAVATWAIGTAVQEKAPSGGPVRPGSSPGQSIWWPGEAFLSLFYWRW